MTPLIAVLERLEKRYATAYEDVVLRHGPGTSAALLRVKRDMCRELRVELQADAKASPEGGGGDAR